MKLTGTMPVIHTLLTFSKWYIAKIFGLKFHLTINDINIFFFEIPWCAIWQKRL